MRRDAPLKTRVAMAAFIAGCMAIPPLVQAGDPVYADTPGGHRIWARIDNRSNPPTVDQVTLDATTDPPNVTLNKGEDQSGLLAWRIWCTTTAGGTTPADIGAITTPGSYNYTVKLLNPYDGPGAANLSSALLEPANSHHSAIVGSGSAPSRISGDLTSNLTVQADSGGDGGTLALTIDGDAYGSISANDVDTLTIGGSMFADLRLWGGLSAPGVVDVGESVFGDIIVQGNPLAGTIHVTGSAYFLIELLYVDLAVGGQILIDENFSGQLLFADGLPGTSDMYGDIHIGGDLIQDGAGVPSIVSDGGMYDGATIAIDGSMTTDPSNLVVTAPQIVIAERIDAGATVSVGVDLKTGIEVQSNMGGTILVGGDVNTGNGRCASIKVDGTMTDAARIEINGSFWPNTSTYFNGDEIEVTGSLESQAAIVVDYDGWHDGHAWVSGATVQVGSTEYTGNAPAGPDHVWEITPCRGDVDGDGSVTLFDINGFVAVFDPEHGGSYGTLYPGLDGSRWYHADANCDGSVNLFDIDPFIARIQSQDCDCGLTRPGHSASQSSTLAENGLSAADCAALLDSGIMPALKPALVAEIQALAEQYDGELAQYWTDVANYLQQ